MCGETPRIALERIAGNDIPPLLTEDEDVQREPQHAAEHRMRLPVLNRRRLVSGFPGQRLACPRPDYQRHQIAWEGVAEPTTELFFHPVRTFAVPEKPEAGKLTYWEGTPHKAKWRRHPEEATTSTAWKTWAAPGGATIVRRPPSDGSAAPTLHALHPVAASAVRNILEQAKGRELVELGDEVHNHGSATGGDHLDYRLRQFR